MAADNQAEEDVVVDDDKSLSEGSDTDNSSQEVKSKVATKKEGPAKLLLDRAWAELSAEEQNEILASIELPTNIYRAFHRSVATQGDRLPAEFKKRYEEAMSKEGRRGQSTGKKSELQTLCKLWLLEIRCETGDADATKPPKAMKWDRGIFKVREWASHTQRTTRQQDAVGWGRIIGIHFGEENALAALKRNEVTKVQNPDWALGCDLPQCLYDMISHHGPMGSQ